MTTRITKAIRDYQHEVSPEGMKETRAITDVVRKKHGIPGTRQTAADMRFDAMVSLREALTEEIERRPAARTKADNSRALKVVPLDMKAYRTALGV